MKRDRCPGDCPDRMVLAGEGKPEAARFLEHADEPSSFGPAVQPQVFTHRRWSDGTHDWLPVGSTVDTPVVST